MDIEIPETDLEGFNDQSKETLKQALVAYADQLIDESNRIEASNRTTEGDPEVTSSMVDSASVLLRRGLAKPRGKMLPKILRIAAAVLSLAAGFMYDARELQDSTYLLTFIIVVSAAILAVTVSTIRE